MLNFLHLFDFYFKVSCPSLYSYHYTFLSRPIQRRPGQKRLKPANPGPVLRKRKIQPGAARQQQNQQQQSTSVLSQRKIKVNREINGPNQRKVVKVKTTTTLRPDTTDADSLLTKSTGSGRAIIRLVSTVSPKPFKESFEIEQEEEEETSTEVVLPRSSSTTAKDLVESETRTPTIIARRRIPKPWPTSVITKETLERSSSSRPGKKRTLIRRLPLRGGNGMPKTTSPTLPKLSPTNITSTGVTSTTQQVLLRDKLKNRMRIKDSGLLSRVQGKFRSTTPKPEPPVQPERVSISSQQSKVQSGSSTENPKSNDSTPRSNVKVVKRTRIKGRLGTTARPITSSTASIVASSTLTTEKPLRDTSTIRIATKGERVTTDTVKLEETTTERQSSTTPSDKEETTTFKLTTTPKPSTARSPTTKTTEPPLKASSETVKPTTEKEGKATTDADVSPTTTERTNQAKKTPSRSGVLRDDLLAAIRRKISKNRTTPSNRGPTTPSGPPSRRPSKKQYQASSPATNKVTSTDRPGQIGPILPSQEPRLPKPRVQFYLRDPVSNRKQNKQKISTHLQGKLARLNAAISEGLANERRKLLLRKTSTTEAPIAVESEKEREERERQLKMRQKLLDRSRTRTRGPILGGKSSAVDLEPKSADANVSNQTSTRTTVSNTSSNSKVVLSIVKKSETLSPGLATEPDTTVTEVTTSTEETEKVSAPFARPTTVPTITSTFGSLPPLTTIIPIITTTLRTKRTTTQQSKPLEKVKVVENQEHPSSHFRPQESERPKQKPTTYSTTTETTQR